MNLLSLNFKWWNRAEKAPATFSSQAETLIDILQQKAQQHPNQIAYRFLQEGETETETITYRELERKAQAIAHFLSQQGATPQARALLLYLSSIDFIAAFLGCLAAGVIAVPATLPRRREKTSRLEAIAQNCQARFILTTESLLPTLTEKLTQNSHFVAMQWIATDTISTKLSVKWEKPELQGDAIAFLQYTSGSTGNPKGVVVTHRNILYNQRMIQAGFSHTEKTIFVGWLPLFHDMGLIGNVLQPLYLGIPCVLMPPEAFLLKPIRWLKAISRYQATTSGGPNFAYDLLNQIPSEQLEGLALSSWDIAYCGAEPIRAATLEEFTQKFKPYGFRPEALYPCYGMAETTLFVSGGLKNQPPTVHHLDVNNLAQNQAVLVTSHEPEAQQIVSCGKTWLEQQIMIVDPYTFRQCAEGQVGEIWLSGNNVGQGYWNNPQETEKIFQVYLQNNPSQPFLRTGDLGYLFNGELFVTGRLKDLIIIRGRNYYPQDIELTVEQSHPALRKNSGAVFGIDFNDETRLIIAQEVERTHLRKLNQKEVIEAVRLAVSCQHNLQVHQVLLLKPGSIYKTSSGKIQRSACQMGFLQGKLNVLAA